MSRNPHIRIPPDSTGKRIQHSAYLEIHVDTLVNPSSIAVGTSVYTPSGVHGDIYLVEYEVDGVTPEEIYIVLAKGSQENVIDGEIIYRTNDDLNLCKVAYSAYGNNTYYTQDIHLVGGAVPTNKANVDKNGALSVGFVGGSNLYDSFGKLQTSETTIIREYQPVYDTLPEEFEEYISGNASISFNPVSHAVEMFTGTSSGDHCRRRSHIYHKYQTGIGTTVLFSMYLGDSGKVGVHRKVGLYDDRDGVYFHAMENSPNGLGVVVRSSTSGIVTETHYHQNVWNVDRLDGSDSVFNISGHLLDPTKIQVMFIDFQWLGGGRIRFGFVIDGDYIICHEVNNANNITGPYMRTGSLPLTMEQYNVSGTTASYMYNVSAAVKCEGKFQPREFLSSGSLPPAVTIPASSDQDYVFIGAIRPVKRIAYADKYSSTLTGLIYNSSNNSITSNLVDLTSNYEVGDIVILQGDSSLLNRNIAMEITSSTGGIPSTLFVDSGNIVKDETTGTCVLSSRYTTDNRAIAIPIDITLTDISNNGHPIWVELVKNATLEGDYKWIDAYPGNAFDAAKPSTGVSGVSFAGNVMYTTVFKGETTFELDRHFGQTTELIHRKANIDEEPDNYSIRARMFDPSHEAEIFFSISWKEIR